jgi:hypothetical protein
VAKAFVERLADLGCLERVRLDEHGKQVYRKVRNPSPDEEAAIQMTLSRGAAS